MTLLNRKLTICLLICLLAVPASRAGWFSLGSKDRQEFIQARETYRNGNYAEAVSQLSKYIYKTKNIKRREARAYRLLGLSYEQLNKPEKALEIYLEALEFHQKDIPLLLSAAQLYQRTGLIDQSIELYDRVLALDAHNQQALAGQAENYIEMGFYSKSRHYYDQFFALNPQAPAVNRARYAYAFLKQRNYPNAFIHITMAKTEDIANAQYWLLSAYAYRGLNRPEEALADLEIAIWLAPDQPELRAIKSMWLYQLGKYNLSLQTAQALVKENPQDELALFMVYLNTKNTQPRRAKQALQQIQTLNQDSLAHRIADKLLRK